MKSTRLQRSTNRTSSDMIWNLNLRAVTAGLYRKLFDWCWSARYKVRSFSCQLYIGTCSQLKFFLVTFQTLQTLTKNGLVASFSFKTARKKDGEGVVEKLRLLRAVALSTSPFPSLFLRRLMHCCCCAGSTPLSTPSTEKLDIKFCRGAWNRTSKEFFNFI